MSYSSHDHGRSGCHRNVPYPPVGVGEGSVSYLERTSHPLINTWKEKLNSQEGNRKWDINEGESFQSGWIQRRSDGSCHEGFSQASINTFQCGYSIVYQSYQEVRIDSYDTPLNSLLPNSVENNLGGIRHSISHLLHRKPVANKICAPARKRPRSEKRFRLKKCPSSDSSSRFALESPCTQQNICAENFPSEEQSSPARSSPSHLKELNFRNPIFKETSSSPWSEYNSAHISRSPIAGQENATMKLKKTSGLEDSYFRHATKKSKKNRHAKRNASKQSKNACSPPCKTKVFTLPLDSSTFFGTNSSDESKRYNNYTSFPGSGSSLAQEKHSGCSDRSEGLFRPSPARNTARRRRKRHSSQSRRCKESLESSVGEKSSMNAVAATTENSSLKSLQKGRRTDNNVMTTPMTTGRLSKHGRRSSTGMRTPTTLKPEDANESKSRRPSPSKSDVKPKALIKPGLRSAKKQDPSKTLNINRKNIQLTPMKITDSCSENKKLVQKTIDNFFSRSSSKSSDGTQDGLKIQSKGSTCKGGAPQAQSAREPGSQSADSHVRRIYQEDGQAIVGLSIPVVRIAPLSDAEMVKSECETVARLARIAPIVSTFTENEASQTCTSLSTPLKRPPERSSTPSPTRKRSCPETPSPSEDSELAVLRDDFADPKEAAALPARRTSSKRLRCCSPVSEAASKSSAKLKPRLGQPVPSDASPAGEQTASVKRAKGQSDDQTGSSSLRRELLNSPTATLPRRSPVKAILQSPAKVTLQSPVKAILQSPVKAILQSPVKAILQSPAKAILQSPVKAILQSPVKAIPQSPAKATLQSPAKAILQSPVKPILQSPAKAARQSPAKAALQSPAKAARQSPAKAALQSPAKLPRRSPAKAEPKAYLSPDDEFAQAKWEEVNSRAEAALAAARNKTRHSRGRKVYVYCSVLNKELERHPVQNEIPENNWSRWLNPMQLRILTLAMLGNQEICLNYSLESEYNQEREDFWMALAKRLNNVCFNPLTNLNTGLRMTVAEWKNLWIELRARLIDRTKAMTPLQRRHSLGSLECMLFSMDLYERLKKSNGECLGEDCPRIWCAGASVGVPSPNWSFGSFGR